MLSEAVCPKYFSKTLSFTYSEKVILLKIFFWVFHKKKYYYSRNIYKNVFKYKKAAIDSCSINRSNHWRCSIKGPLSSLRQFLIVERPLKKKKKAVSFIPKVLFALEIFTFLSWHFDYVEKGLDKKAIVNLKIFDVTDIIAIHILPNICRGKDNQEMEFGQLIKYSVRNIFLKNHAENKAGRLVLCLFSFFFVFLFSLVKVKARDEHLSFNIFW